MSGIIGKLRNHIGFVNVDVRFYIYRGGLMPGDIVTDINDVRVKSSNAVYEALDSHSVLNMRIFRGHGYYDVVVYPEDVV